MKREKKWLAALLLALMLTGPLAAGPQVQTTCPVLGGRVDRKVFVDYQGYRVYFCCPGCDVQFRKDPEKYLKKMQELGISLEKSPAAPQEPGK